MIATTELYPLDHVDVRPADCPIDDIQAAASRMFPRDEASQADATSYVWEHWDRLRQVPLAMALAEAKRFAWRMRRRERSPLSYQLEEAAELVAPLDEGQALQELIERVPASLRVLATLLASGYSQTEAARLLATSKAAINRQCGQIRACLRRS